MHSLLRNCLLAGVVATLGAASAAHAQTGLPRPCGTDQVMRQALGADYDNWFRQYQQQLHALQTASRPPGSPPAGPRVIVPVVVHIIHDNGPSNISDDQVHDAMRILNEVFLELDPDTAQVIPYFKPRIGNANIEFRLARLDPDGNCTTGITRHFSPLTHSAGENVKGLIGARWTPQRYLNVWVVENIASGAAGYSYLPCGVGPNQEGIVILNDYFGSIGRSPNLQYNRHAFPHEVGHYLGLPHTWGPGNSPGTAGNCNLDDGIADTPNTTGYSFVCNLNAPACPGDPDLYSNVQNVMDYAGCPSMFTQGQATVMNNGLNPGGFSCRVQLSNATTHQLTGVADGQFIPPCAPIAYLTAVGASATSPVQRLCAGDSIQFHAEAYNVPANSPVQFQWSFPGGQPSTSSAQDPVVIYTVPGTYDVLLRASNAAGTDSVVRAGYVLVKATMGGVATPQVATFENPSFPVDPSDPLKNWEISPATGQGRWEYTGLAAAQGTGSVRVRLRNTTQGSEIEMISPNIVLSTSLQRPYLYFSEAYAPSNSSSADRLTVSYSYDCGRTWLTRGSNSVRAASVLQTAPPTGALFVPTASQWKHDSMLIDSRPMMAGTHLLIRFRATSDQGSALYIDNIRIGGRPLGVEDNLSASTTLEVFPNPSDGNAQIRLSTAQAAGPATVRVYDAMGRLVGQPWQTTHQAGTIQEVSLTKVAGQLQAGVYLVELTTADGARRTQRALVY